MGDDDGDGGGDSGKTFPGHPPIPNEPGDNIARNGIPSLRYVVIHRMAY